MLLVFDALKRGTYNMDGFVLSDTRPFKDMAKELNTHPPPEIMPSKICDTCHWPFHPDIMECCNCQVAIRLGIMAFQLEKMAGRGNDNAAFLRSAGEEDVCQSDRERHLDLVMKEIDTRLLKEATRVVNAKLHELARRLQRGEITEERAREKTTRWANRMRRDKIRYERTPRERKQRRDLAAVGRRRRDREMTLRDLEGSGRLGLIARIMAIREVMLAEDYEES
ncbi:hypothetical protein BJX99DRAFT_254131 [Aspergillus californicus]